MADDGGHANATRKIGRRMKNHLKKNDSELVKKEREALDEAIKKCPSLAGARIRPFPVGAKSRYLGKVFIYVLELKEAVLYSPDEEKIPKKWVKKIHIRPYKINLGDKITKRGMGTGFSGIDYDKGSGNFHKLVKLDEKIEFQVVLVANKYENGEKVGDEAYCPGVPLDVKVLDVLDDDFLKKVDEMGMYFPKLKEPAEENLEAVLESVARKLGVNLSEDLVQEKS